MGLCSYGGVGFYDCFEDDLFYHHSELSFALTVAVYSVHEGFGRPSAFSQLLVVVCSLH